MIGRLIGLFKKKPSTVKDTTFLDQFSEDQCRLDDAHLVFKELCVDLGMPEVSGMVDEAWRQIGNRLFNDGIRRLQI